MIAIIEDQGSRTTMEDKSSIELNIHNDYDYFSIFDGHGDDKVAILAQLYLKEIIKGELFLNEKKIKDKLSLKKNEEQILYDSLKFFNESLSEEIASESGCTAIIILRKGKTYWIANVGDSRIIMNSDLNAVKISTDHKPNLFSEYKRITQGGGFVSNVLGVPRVMGNLALSRALGDLKLNPHVTWIPDIFKIECNETNNFFLAATDGLFDVMSNQEVIDIICDSNLTVENSLKKLIQVSRERNSGDNILILLIGT
jgi:serine/threonine protein phosphatase PrpC